MNILTINSGSSSLKYSVFNMDEKKLLSRGFVERIGLSDPLFSHIRDDERLTESIDCRNHDDAISYVLKFVDSLKVDAVAHRVVHGGEKFRKATLIDEEVELNIQVLSELAPLHNPANLIGIRASKKHLPSIPHIAIFDTSFHNTIPEYAYRYAIPTKWYTEKSFRRYGFHGTSVEFVTARAAIILGPDSCHRMIILHLGNGASITAVCNGKSVDTSMGLTPLEGLIMGTRSGDIDPGLLIAMMRAENMSVDQINYELNSKSGLLGITEKLRDMRDIQNLAEEGDPVAKLAIQMAVYRIQKYIGAYFIILGGLDALIFTGGIGERSHYFRNLVVDGLKGIGVFLEPLVNNSAISDDEKIISSPESEVQVLVIPTNEEYMMALKTLNLIQKEKETA